MVYEKMFLSAQDQTDMQFLNTWINKFTMSTFMININILTGFNQKLEYMHSYTYL